jgi:hypothetical protein
VIVALRSVGLGNERLFLDQKPYSLNVWNVFLGFRCGLAYTLTQHQTVFRFFAITEAPSRFSSLLLAFPSPLLLSESTASPGQTAVWVSRKVIPSLLNQAKRLPRVLDYGRFYFPPCRRGADNFTAAWFGFAFF